VTMSMTRSWQSLLLVGLLFGTASPAFAHGTIVTVSFVGTGTLTGHSGTVNFTGTFTYDESQKVAGTLGKFDFSGSSNTHAISYTISATPPIVVSESGSFCEPYMIYTSTTSKTAFQLTTTMAGPYTVTITVPLVEPGTGTTLDQKHLPFSTGFPNSTPLAAPAAAPTFMVSGAITFSGTIHTIIPSEH
jgi:hypothetical protein